MGVAQAAFPPRETSFSGSSLELPVEVDSLDWRRLHTMSWFGLAFQGGATGLLYLKLNSRLLAGATPLTRTAFDVLLWAPLALLPAYAVLESIHVYQQLCP